MRITICNLIIECWNGNFYNGKYWISLISYGKSKILKLLIPSNERGFNGKITILLQPLLLPLSNGITVYDRSCTIKQVPFTQRAHAWFRTIRLGWKDLAWSNTSLFCQRRRKKKLNVVDAQTGYRRNEFDTTKFTSGLAFRTQSQYDLPSFGLDPDAPVFLTGYGPGGLPVNRSSHTPKRPDSALQVKHLKKTFCLIS